MQEISQNAQNIRVKREINAYHFYQSQTCENIIKQSKTYQEHMVIFLGFFAKKLNAQVVQTARAGVHVARKIKKTEKKTKKPRVPGPNPRK